MAGGGGGDRLSELSDDLLRRVLHFAPAKEAASTGALSRRLRSLWRTSAAVNLEARVPKGLGRRCRRHRRSGGDADPHFFSLRDAFVSAAKAALAAAGDPVRRLTFRLEAECEVTILDFLGRDSTDGWKDMDVVEDVLSHPAARRVEELRFAAVKYARIPWDYEVSSTYGIGQCELGLGSLPSLETLRVLDLTNCRSSTPPPPASNVAFPRLASLRLRRCFVPLEHLQAVIDASPELATVHLEYVFLAEKKNTPDWGHDPTDYVGLSPPKEEINDDGVVLRLRCPAATTLVLHQCGWTQSSSLRPPDVAVEIDAPRLRRFRYKGLLRQLSLSPPAAPARVELHVADRRPDCDRATFWRLLHNFRAAKELKLAVHRLEEIAVVNAAERAELLRHAAFTNLERLELQGVHRPKGNTAAAAIANLLCCCPVLRDLRINLATAQSDATKQPRYGCDFLQRRSRDDLRKSMDHFTRRRFSDRNAPLERGDDDDDDEYDEVSEIPALSGRSFRCLRSSLRRVSLQFRAEKTNCFGLRLIKFFAENAMVLDELRIDGGNWMIREHMNRRVQRWIANYSERRNSPGSTSLVVLPLER